ncbi:AmmeMemoRadiSam system protein A [Clostridium magnum]|uniref:3,4-dihydroxyphenylacetate 2,3-dioxygenase n=1 Tax=Clostridium magnum DSM 2767 TaxID=1121326 RepID=A0A162SGE4_9CLOT|nr:AmmeMemoRadiSam system protein A [Clostridium magnum]KZL91219.1 3,4-dihydroxyphenylacetate 2,3-dioxygenase [Clostridium magnum DSM 2767]SHI33210.1 uncharacterized protein, PH0010 family/AmmeMemoRadiSam system protein A/AmmeMemoRadiSam system protein B [Clostridium magnum DSM 2767]
MSNILGYYLMPHPPIIIPEIGKGEERKASATMEACIKVADEINKLNPDTIIIITPHGPVFRDAISVSDSDYLSGDFSNFNAPDVQFNSVLNSSLTEEIVKYAFGMGIPMVAISEDSAGRFNIEYELDHGTMVPLYFINQKLNNYKLVHITYGFLSEVELYKFGVVIKQAVERSNTKAVIIASGDLSHRVTEDAPYGYSPHGKTFDTELLDMLKNGNALNIFKMDKNIIESAGECGLRSVYILLGTMDQENFKGEVLSYEAPFGIGYGVVKLSTSEGGAVDIVEKISNLKDEAMKVIRDSEDEYVRLARETLEYHVKTGKFIATPSYVTKEMLNEKRGVFVSLKMDGELRGCIGTVFPSYDNIAEEIMKNAIEAGERDPRFNPVEEEELNNIVYSVDVLMPAEKASKEMLDPKKFGVIVRSGHRTGLLLPDLSGVDTVKEQISIALNKAGIEENENYSIERFEVIRHK